MAGDPGGGREPAERAPVWSEDALISVNVSVALGVSPRPQGLQEVLLLHCPFSEPFCCSREALSLSQPTHPICIVTFMSFHFLF